MRLIGVGLLVIVVLWTAGWVAQYLSQTRYVSVQAQVASKSCYQASDGGDGGGTFTACNVTVLYNAPDGTSGTVQLPGVGANRIRRQSGHETLLICFADKSSETPVSPQDVVPMWAIIFLVTVVDLPFGIAGAACLRAGFKRPSHTGTIV